MLTPIPIVMAGVSFHVDIARLFHGDREHAVVQVLRMNENVDVDIATIDERRLQRYYIESLTQPPDWIVLGSSRAMSIRRDMTTSGSFYNHAVSSAVLEDFIGVLAVYDARGRLPAHVILGVDPWIMNGLGAPAYWHTFRDLYGGMADTMAVSIRHPSPALDFHSLRVTKATELLSPSYFQACLRQIKYETGHGLRPPEPTDNEIGDRSKILKDGSLLYPRSRYARARAVIRRDILMRSVALKSGGGFDRIDKDLAVAWRRLVTFLSERTDLTLVFMPYHPLEYDRMTTWQGYSVAPAVEAEAKAFATAKRVRYIGSYDPAAMGCDESEFFDAGHPRPRCAAKVMARLLE